MGVHTRNQGRYQDHPQSGGLTVQQGLLLDSGKVTAAQSRMGSTAQSVELEKHRAEPGFFEGKSVVLVSRQTQAVGVELEKGKPLAPAQGYDLHQVVAHGRFATGQLNVAGTGGSHDPVIEKADPAKRWVVRFISIGTRIRKTNRATEIAALGDFNQGSAGMLAMVRAETAIKRDIPDRLR